ncbi:MAG: hypothetical protein QOJ99_6194 [Bryobacterales bacterium]|jgi:hypothetical protein|nr:hypothetical protein [Bryobacterales bacterium]
MSKRSATDVRKGMVAGTCWRPDGIGSNEPVSALVGSCCSRLRQIAWRAVTPAGRPAPPDRGVSRELRRRDSEDKGDDSAMRRGKVISAVVFDRDLTRRER